MPHVAATASELLTRVRGALHLEDGRVVVDDVGQLRGDAIRDIAWTAAFGTDEGAIAAAQWLTWEISQATGARSASIHDLYMARARGEVGGFTVPAINIRAQTFDMARIIFETAAAADAGAVILELARSEQTYTFQRPIDYATACLAGAVAAGWQGPVFLQGDHYQFNAKKYAADAEAMTEEIRRACRLAIDAGYRNIDIDSSTLVDLSLPTVEEQQRANYERSAELHAYLDGLRRELGRRAPGAVGISKVSVQTGTSHGGVVLPDGTVAKVAVDFDVHRRLGEVARKEYGLAGTVQHGASTLPDDQFHIFRDVETAEIHLATGFQNALYEHPAFPAELHAKIEAWCFENALDERKADQTDQQFVYTTRKKAIGPFKRELWDLETKDEILAAQATKIGFLFRELGVVGTRSTVDAHVQPVELHRPAPAGISAAEETASAR
jgi:fructose/tagatose bisphosphate aldolase